MGFIDVLETFTLKINLFKRSSFQLSLFIALLSLAGLSYGKPVEKQEALEFTPLQSSTAKEIATKLQSRHYVSHSLNDRVSSQFLDNYIQRLDSSRTLFLQSDLAEFEVYRDKLDDSLKKGGHKVILCPPDYYLNSNNKAYLHFKLRDLRGYKHWTYPLE